ncbi:MAG: phosphoribosylformylglycinamidine synthase [Ruminococcaceae bacterium]|nr:phosphoribosylformylglycinamidine synthase [Oscillospiraceae bacterium]
MNRVRRIYVEKKKGFDVEANHLFHDLKENLNLTELTGVRIIQRYDVQGVSDEAFAAARTTIFSEPPVDVVYDEVCPLPEKAVYFNVAYLPGQYDQRADSAAECVQLLTQQERPTVLNARVIVLEGNVSAETLAAVKKYYINPVEAHEVSDEKPETLDQVAEVPADVATVTGFITMDEEALSGLLKTYGFAMDDEDLRFCRDYFKNTEKRDPSLTELRMIDTYWSDHCRHTTFATEIENIDDSKAPERVKAALSDYQAARKELYVGKNKTLCLMDLATIAVKKLKKDGYLTKLDQSEEINACSIEVMVDIDGKKEPWLIMFKNETHNHPTEIEPFGGAATCLGGAIRDPLSGRSYVYQAMRVTGSGDPRKTLSETLPGKLMQRKITTGAAAGYSSYGNQIGLATGQVTEIYDEGYVAKRMEIGAVIAAAPKKNVVRERPAAGDIIILLGGRTGRDGCGGATGSSKAHDDHSLESCGAEVQKGNAPVERKLQRLFRKEEAAQLIKRCNDFGAGGVSVAVGELADGLFIDLDKVPKKYEGLDGTELAISESQERMAVVIAPENEQRFFDLAREENLEATRVAVVTEEPRLKMQWRGKLICDISREFLNTNGATKHTNVALSAPETPAYFKAQPVADLKKTWLDTLSSLNVCSQKGLCERFDASIGAGTVLMPFGGKYQLTPEDCMAAKVPTPGQTDTATLMSFGYQPRLAKESPFDGAVYAVIESLAKIVAAGGDRKEVYLTFQEYFPRLHEDPARWGLPFAALLGAYRAQTALGIGAIGGKDSMSGSFNDLDVPPTLVSFAVVPTSAKTVVSGAFKETNSALWLIAPQRLADGLPNFDDVKAKYDALYDLIQKGLVRAAYTIKEGGIAAAVSKMAFGNKIGAKLCECVKDTLFVPNLGAILIETAADCEVPFGKKIGETCADATISIGETSLAIDEMLTIWRAPLEGIFPTKAFAGNGEIPVFNGKASCPIVAKSKIARPRVFIPVFPGTNCEYDSAKAFNNAGAESDIFVLKNLTPADITDSVSEFVKRIKNSQIIMLPGGFSAGDEPEGSGKFIATVFRNPAIRDAVTELLEQRDGLMLGICNGFQALIKLGLVPYGKICDLEGDSPTLTYNAIGRHVSQMVYTRVASCLSPWLSEANVGDIHAVPVSHGEGRFVASKEWVEKLSANGQIATQYVDLSGNPTYETAFNPNGSVCAIEGITSPDGRILGKMAHSERRGNEIAKNIYGEQDQKIFLSGVKYFG